MQETLVSLNVATFHIVSQATGLRNYDGVQQTLHLSSRDGRIKMQIDPAILPFIVTDDLVAVTLGFIKAKASIPEPTPPLIQRPGLVV